MSSFGDILALRRKIKRVQIKSLTTGDMLMNLTCGDGLIKSFTVDYKSFLAIKDAMIAASVANSDFEVDWDLTNRG